ncbi:MAG: adenylate kinase [Pseudomonadota bacterium]
MAEDLRIAILGNAGGGKSTLARRLANDLDLPHVELDRLLWLPDWTPAPAGAYGSAHAQAIAANAWIIDGMGLRESISPRLLRTTAIVLIDMPIWAHYWLAAERQIAWNRDAIDNPPAGASAPPPTEALFQTIFEIDRTWMPKVRDLVDEEAQRGKPVVRISSVDELRRGIDPLLLSGPAGSE